MANQENHLQSKSVGGRYMPLDGLRAIAIIAVFMFHYEPNLPGMKWGWVGVDLFFALSGYLISGILYDSLSRPRYFQNFYIRRCLRIFPIYWSYWFVLFLIVAATATHIPPLILTWPLYFGNFATFYCLNIHQPFFQLETIPLNPHLAFPWSITLGHFWTLCVEEQYYLIWPLVLWLVRDRLKLIKVSILLLLANLAVRIAYHFTFPPEWIASDLIQKLTLTRLDALLLGSVVAFFARDDKHISDRLANVFYISAAVSVILMISSRAWFGSLETYKVGSGWVGTYGYTLVAIASIGVLVAALKSRTFANVLTLKPLLNLGKVSYGFYIFHMFFLGSDQFVPNVPHRASAVHLLHLTIFAVTWCISNLSFRYFEMPLLSLKDKFAPAVEKPVVV